MAVSNRARAAAASFLLPVLFMLGLAQPAFALKSDRQQLLNVDADKLDAGLDDNRAVLEGNVRITQGTLVIQASEATLTQGAQQETQRVLLVGTPVTLEQDLDDGGRLKARANRVDYDVEGETIVLTGNASVSQPRGDLSGETIVYNTVTGKLNATSAGAGRVHLQVQPKAAPPPPATPTP